MSALPPHLEWWRGRLICWVCTPLVVAKEPPLDHLGSKRAGRVHVFSRKPRNRAHLAALLRIHRRCALTRPAPGRTFGHA